MEQIRGTKWSLESEAVSLHGRLVASSKRNIQSLSSFYLFSSQPPNPAQKLMLRDPGAFHRWRKVLKLLSGVGRAEHLNFYRATLRPPSSRLLAQTCPAAAFDKSPLPCPTFPLQRIQQLKKFWRPTKEFCSRHVFCYFCCIRVLYWHCESEIVTVVWWPTVVAKQICPRGPICPVPPHYTYSSLLTPQDDNWKDWQKRHNGCM